MHKKYLLYRRYSDEDVCIKINSFFQLVLEVIIKNVANNYTPLLTSLVQIMDNDSNFYLSRGKREDDDPDADPNTIYAIQPVNTKFHSYSSDIPCRLTISGHLSTF